MNILLVMKTARSAVIEIEDGGRYYTKKNYVLRLNGTVYGKMDRVITSLYNLQPETTYTVEVVARDEVLDSMTFTTDYEFVTLDVRQFGAKGDGESDDTHFIQAAIMAAPENSRVLIPAGVYRITSLFLKSHLRLELAEGAELKAFNEREKFAVLPPSIESVDKSDEYFLGTWEGDPQPMFAAIISGYHVEDVMIYGAGTINGNATGETWWNRSKVMRTAWRPRLFHINGCRKVTLAGITVCNSPSWTLHPYFSEDLRFIGLNIRNPFDSPNTDGLDPESCRNVDILGVHFSVGDDCIAIKSGKIFMGRRFKRPTEHVQIRQCFMENGHGAVTLGSEIGGGVKDVVVQDCLFKHTDRGLRIKTRRGRGKDSIISDIIFRDLTLDHVMTPLVVNAFYFCDPDGKCDYVQSREVCPVDERTPVVKKMVFENMTCTNCHVAAAWFEGLPEQKIEELVLKDISISFAENPQADIPAMACGVEACTRKGLWASNVAKVVLENVKIEGQVGQTIEFFGVDELVKK
ncbi:MAG: glycoside hydrolase family 28 protein [Lachnospiraceae bacterium]|nr:glycoside hydrolase family 28 protein [Lachnospiraceae bacterium]